MRLSTPSCLLCILFFLSHQYLNAQCPTADAGPDKTICQNGSVQIGPAQPVGNVTYAWSPAESLSNPHIANPLASPWANTTYTLTVIPANTNLLVNGDFSQGNVGFVTDSSYTLAPTGNDITHPGAYAITASPSDLYHEFCSGGDHTPNNAMMVVDGSTTGGAACWRETVAVTPNTSYNFLGWYMATTLMPAMPGITVTINGVVVFGPLRVENYCSWTPMTASWNSGSDTTATIAISSSSPIGNGNDFALDDLLFYEGCPPSQASTTVSIANDPYMSMAWVTDGFDWGNYAMNNITGQNDMCGYYQAFLHLTLRANRDQVAWFVDGAPVTSGTAVPGFISTATITQNGQVLNLYDNSNDYSNHYFQVSAIGPGCTVLSPRLYFRRVPNALKFGSGYITANTLGTIPQRNTAYTFNVENIAPSIFINYGMGTSYSWSIPGVTYSVNPFDHRYVTITVPPMYSPSVDPITGNHYIPGTVTISNSSYACLNTSYSINFAVPAVFPNRAEGSALGGQSTLLEDGSGVSGGVQIFPNPATDVVWIRPGAALGRDGYVEVFTGAGVRVRLVRAAEAAAEGLLQVNVKGLAAGLYFVAVHGKGRVERVRFMVVR